MRFWEQACQIRRVIHNGIGVERVQRIGKLFDLNILINYIIGIPAIASCKIRALAYASSKATAYR